MPELWKNRTFNSQCHSKKETGCRNPNHTNYVQEDELPDVTELDTAVFRVTKKQTPQLGDKPIIVPVVIL